MYKQNKSGEKNKNIASEKEEDVYKALIMEWIPPELREGRGEIEASINCELPVKLLELKCVKGDLHIHTIGSDGGNTIEEVFAAAIEKM